MIDNNNYELWLLRYAEGDLTAAEREAVEAWLAGHPEAAEELSLYNEAPRLECDESVRYVAVARQHTQPLWPVVLRWSAAAAVVVALMVPALRMGTMGKIDASEPTPLVAEATEVGKVVKRELTERLDKKERANPIESIASIAPIDTVPTIPATDPSSPESVIIEVNSLIVYEADWTSGDTLYTTNLIAYDRSADWGDALLAANDAFQDNLASRPLGRLVSRALPDSRQLEENVVEPLREKIDNIKSIIK